MARNLVLSITSDILDKCQKSAVDFNAENFFGITARILKDEPEVTQEQINFRLKLLRELNVHNFREDFLWKMIEPQKHVFNVQNYLDLMNVATFEDLHVLPILAYGNSLYNSNTTQDEYRPPAHLADIEPYIDEVVKLISQRDSVYEIWNEPNSSFLFWKKGILGQPKEFGDLVKVVANRLRLKDPNAKIVLGGLFSASTRINVGLIFLRELYKHHPDIHRYYDVLGWHPYRYPQSAPETSNLWQVSLHQEMENLRQFYLKQGLTPKPIWLTELGWHTAEKGFPPGVSPKDQADYLVRSHITALASGVERYYWYRLVDGPNSRYNLEDAFGLYQSDHQLSQGEPAAKPSFYAYKNMIHLVSPFNKIIDLKKYFPLARAQHLFLLCSDRNLDFLLINWQTGGVKFNDPSILVPENYHLENPLVPEKFGDENEGGEELQFTSEPAYTLGGYR